MKTQKVVGLKKFCNMFFSLLDKEDRKKFVGFVFILMIGGFLALLGVASVVPVLYVLLSPEKIKQLPLLGHFDYLQSVVVCVASMIFFFWLKSLASILILKKQSTFLFGLTKKIQLKIYQKYLSSSYAEHVKKNISSLMSVLSTDINTVSYSIFSSTGILLNEAITSLILFIALLFWAPWFTILVIGVTIIFSKLYLQIFKNKANNYGRFKTESYNQLSRCITQSLGSFKETKLYHKESVFFATAEAAATKIATADGFNVAFSNGARFIIESVAITVVLILLIADVFSGVSTAKIMTLISVFGVAAVQLLPSINRIVYALANIKYGTPSMQRLYNESQVDQVQTNRCIKNDNCLPLEFSKIFRLENMSFSYGDKVILKNFSLEIPKNKKVAFVGESGAGKTTLADIILGLLMPNLGEIYVDDVKLGSENKTQWQAMLGYIPQMIYIYDTDIRGNIAFGIPESDIDNECVRLCLDKAALIDFVDALPNNIYTQVGENGIQLSGGQRQRIGIARALYRNPSVLVMDEATAALDNKTELEVTQALTRAGEDKTIITIAHRMSTIQHYDVIYFLEKGEVLAHGNYQELMSSCEAFKKFVTISSHYQEEHI